MYIIDVLVIVKGKQWSSKTIDDYFNLNDYCSNLTCLNCHRVASVDVI